MIKEEKIIDAIRRRHKKDREFQISRVIPEFFGGELVIVDVLKEQQYLSENYAYVTLGEVEATFLSMDDLAAWSSNKSNRRGSRFSLLSVEAISGFIAVIITITICGIVFFSLMQPNNNGYQAQIPDILSNALTTILGFYFGSQVGRTALERRQEEKETASVKKNSGNQEAD